MLRARTVVLAIDARGGSAMAQEKKGKSRISSGFGDTSASPIA